MAVRCSRHGTRCNKADIAQRGELGWNNVEQVGIQEMVGNLSKSLTPCRFMWIGIVFVVWLSIGSSSKCIQKVADPRKCRESWNSDLVTQR